LHNPFRKDADLREPARFHSFPDLPDGENVVRGTDVDEDPAFRRLDATSGAGPDEADRVRQVAETEKKKAYEAGLAKGLEKGKAEAVAELDAVIQRLRLAYMDIEKYRKQLYINAEEDAVELSLAVARKIIRREISVDHEVVLNVVKGALEKVIDHEKVKIRINPTDLETVQTALFQFSTLVENLENVHFEADGAITAGGCIVETRFGNIDARIENQLDQISGAFAAELEKSKHNN